MSIAQLAKVYASKKHRIRDFGSAFDHGTFNQPVKFPKPPRTTTPTQMIADTRKRKGRTVVN